MKLLLKLAIVALLANATWHLWAIYSAHFKFKDAVQAAAQYGSNKSEDELRSRILELAAQYDLPITEASFTVRREAHHTIVDGSYERKVELAPGFVYPWPFSWRIDTLSVEDLQNDRLIVPK
jgi:hypothetical protein